MQWPETTAVAGGAVDAGREAGRGMTIGAALASGAAADTQEPGGGRPETATALTAVGSPAGFAELDLPCRDDPELFFAELPEDVERAKAICRACPARLACLAGAMKRGEPCGVWGGELFVHGQVVPRKRPRGRPRKTEVAA
jgi:WhiB family transcriptional regulator, redox-sensing transcriptional regulator